MKNTLEAYIRMTIDNQCLDGNCTIDSITAEINAVFINPVIMITIDKMLAANLIVQHEGKYLRKKHMTIKMTENKTLVFDISNPDSFLNAYCDDDEHFECESCKTVFEHAYKYCADLIKFYDRHDVIENTVELDVSKYIFKLKLKSCPYCNQQLQFDYSDEQL